MTGALIGAVVILAGVIAVQVGATIWLTKQLVHSLKLSARDADVAGALREEALELKHELIERAETLRDTSYRLDREVTARKHTEENLAKAIDELAKTGSPKRVADALRADLGRLRALSEDVPELPADAGAGDG